jgi:predicted ribosomally synthesized peptide with SipW-like signal peptide
MRTPGRHSERLPVWRRVDSVRVRAFFALGVVGVLAATGGTFANWTDSATISGTTFTAGSIDLKINNSDTVTGYTTLNLSTMVPANTVAGVLVIKNTGTASVKYTAVSTASNADAKGLGAALVVKVTGDASVTGSSPAATCAGTALTGTGTALGGNLVTTGRLLAGGASENLCVQVTLPSNASSALQGATTNVGFTFTATTDLS